MHERGAGREIEKKKREKARVHARKNVRVCMLVLVGVWWDGGVGGGERMLVKQQGGVD